MQIITNTNYYDKENDWLYRLVKVEWYKPHQSDVYKKELSLLINSGTYREPNEVIEGEFIPLNEYDEQILQSAFVYCEMNDCDLIYALQRLNSYLADEIGWTQTKIRYPEEVARTIATVNGRG